MVLRNNSAMFCNGGCWEGHDFTSCGQTPFRACCWVAQRFCWWSDGRPRPSKSNAEGAFGRQKEFFSSLFSRAISRRRKKSPRGLKRGPFSGDPTRFTSSASPPEKLPCVATHRLCLQPGTPFYCWDFQMRVPHPDRSSPRLFCPAVPWPAETFSHRLE